MLHCDFVLAVRSEFWPVLGDGLFDVDLSLVDQDENAHCAPCLTGAPDIDDCVTFPGTGAGLVGVSPPQVNNRVALNLQQPYMHPGGQSQTGNQPSYLAA